MKKKRIKVYEPVDNVFVFTYGDTRSAIVFNSMENTFDLYCNRFHSMGVNFKIRKTDKESNAKFEGIFRDVGFISYNSLLENKKIFKEIKKQLGLI